MTRAIVATHRIFPETVQLLQKAGRVHMPADERFAGADLADALASARAAMIFMPDRVDAEFLAAAPELSIVAAALKGYDNIDVEACTARRVWVSIVPDLLTAPTAELAIGLLIGLARHLREADRHVRSGNFSGWTPRFYGLSIEYSTIGLVGMGAIGCAVARRLRGFDCRIIACDERPGGCPVDGIAWRPLEALLAEADIVVLCLPLHASTIHLLNADRLALMKPHALLVNPARGSLVDEAAVAAALLDSRLGGYAADAFELEDLSRSDRPRAVPPALLAHPNTLFGAHIGSATVTARKAIEARAARNILDALAGRTPRDAVNEVGGEPCRAPV
ncbi:MAG TPA: NAD(P)-dependent oxidoreductase [Xanthobacteraceae bacterium]|nr:NAD(P)-dependent oxidoreductase [Xanthobacteraceae bacterium]